MQICHQYVSSNRLQMPKTLHSCNRFWLIGRRRFIPTWQRWCLIWRVRTPRHRATFLCNRVETAELTPQTSARGTPSILDGRFHTKSAGIPWHRTGQSSNGAASNFPTSWSLEASSRSHVRCCCFWLGLWCAIDVQKHPGWLLRNENSLFRFFLRAL